MRTLTCIATLGWMCTASLAWGQASNSAYVVTNPNRVPALTAASSLQQRVAVDGNPASNSLRLVQNLGQVPSVAVSRDVALTPTRPDLIRLVYGNATAIYIDPQVDYMKQSQYTLDDKFSILQAQQLARTLRNPGATVVRNPLAKPVMDASQIKPRAIFHVPAPLERKHQEPTIKKVNGRQVAQLD